jgi:hypothetical protein
VGARVAEAALCGVMTSGQSNADGALPSQLNHPIYATPDLEATVAGLEVGLGVSVAGGGSGSHTVLDTRNALLPPSARQISNHRAGSGGFAEGGRRSLESTACRSSDS